MAHQVSHKNEAALQYADEQRLFPGVIAGDLRAELADARMDLLLTEQYGRNIFSHSLSSSEIGKMVTLQNSSCGAGKALSLCPMP